MGENAQNERINYLKDRIYHDAKIVYIDDSVMPETFAKDMECILGCNPKTDILICATNGDEEGLSFCTVVVCEKDIERKDLLVKLADYVQGAGLRYILCAFPEEQAIKTQYELDPNDEYVEGPTNLFIGDTVVISDNTTNLLIEGPLELGLDSTCGPSEAAKAIAEGKHFIAALYDEDDSRLL